MELKFQPRTVLGKKVRHLRKEGWVPGEIYGHGFENLHVAVEEKAFRKVFNQAGGSAIVDLISDKGEKMPVIITDVQKDPISGAYLNVDFYKVKADEKITTTIPLKFVGESLAIKEGAVLVKVVDELEVESLPRDIPKEIEVDITKLEKEGDVIRVADLILPAAIKVLVNPETVIVSASAVEEEAETAAPEAEEETETTEPPSGQSETEQ